MHRCIALAICLAALATIPPVAARAADRPAVSLDGKWDFRFAPDDRGTTEKWFAGDRVKFGRQLDVPGCWDAQGVGTATDKLRTNAVGVGWYRRTFTFPADWGGRRVWLVIGGVHRTARVYVNGELAADHVGYPVEIRTDVTSHLHGTEQSLVVAVDSRPDASRDPLYGTFDLADYMNVSWGGIFEHVRLESTGESWVQDPFVRPDPQHHRVDLDLAMAGERGDATVSYTIRGSGTGDAIARGDIPIHDGHAAASIDLPTAPLWAPAHPNLLTLDLTLSRGGKVLDQRQIRFGLRKLEIRGGEFVLNGDKFFLRGYGDDFNFPRTLLPPADVEFWKSYLQKRKDYGFNAVRHHSMMPPESYLAAADEVGMLVQPELPIAYMEFQTRATTRARSLYPVVWERYIRQMRNHPSVMSWCMGNEENNGLPFGPELYHAAKSLDPDRPVIDSDGLPPSTDRPTLDYRSVQFDEHALPWFATHGKYINTATSKAVLVHEMSNLSCLPDPAEAGLFDGTIKPFWLDQMNDAVRRQHLKDALPAMLRASWRLQASLLKLNIEAARLGPGISGYHQWLFRDYWRQSSGIESIMGTTRALTPEAARQFNSDAVLLWDHDRVNFSTGETIPLRIVLSDFRPGDEPTIGAVTARLGEARVQLIPPAPAERRGRIGPWTGTIPAPADLASPKKLTLSAEAGEVRNEWSVWVWPSAPAAGRGIIIARRLTADILKRLEDGASVLLTDDTLAFPTQNATFKPAWWRGDESGDFVHGNVFADHAALAGFPHDGYGDLQTYGLLNDRPVVKLDDVPGDVRPIVCALDVPWKMRRMAYLWEARVGKGKLLVSSFDLSEARRNADPAAAWMHALLRRYAAGPKSEPTATLPADWLRARADDITLPDPATCVEGFAGATSVTAEKTTWFTEREPAAAQYAVRHTDGNQSLTWKTAPLPPAWPHETVTFVWSGGTGYRSQPDAGPFEFDIDGKKACEVPLTESSARWPCGGGRVLRYFVLRRTAEDTAGIFLLTLPAKDLRPGQPLVLTLSAGGKGSRRWISVVPYTDAARRFRYEQCAAVEAR